MSEPIQTKPTIPTPAELLSSIDRARPAVTADPAKALELIHSYGRSQYLDGYERGRERDNVRTLFALRAPTDVPTWFEPKIAAHRPSAPTTSWTPARDTQHADKLHDMQLMTDEELTKLTLVPIAGDPTADMALYVLAQRRYTKAVEAYDARVRLERIAQWPWFWADRIVAADGSGSARLASVGELIKVLEPQIVFSGPAGDPRTQPSTSDQPKVDLIEPTANAVVHCTSPRCQYAGTVSSFKPGTSAATMICPLCGTEQRKPVAR